MLLELGWLHGFPMEPTHHLRGSDSPGQARLPNGNSPGDGPEAHRSGEGCGGACGSAQRGLLAKPTIDYIQALSVDLQLVTTGDNRDALEDDYTAMNSSGMLRVQVPTFSELMGSMALQEQQCNTLARSATHA